MIAVRINGEESALGSSGAAKIADLIELIKTNIDPAHMITRIIIDGKELEDFDWSAPVQQYTNAVLEIETGSPDAYVADRLSQCSAIVGQCFFQFREARKSFQSGKMVLGNQSLGKAVTTLKTFFEWYAALLQLVSEERKKEIDISDKVVELSEVCKRICQQQLYQSWWALGETIAKELEPKLDALEDFFRAFETAQQ